ncbi:MAG: S-isoprenylcysteine methyltransferase [Candidatus Omnitrophica bacterium]|nr:S-isoprenylcysteine methyltransferase [Candidatus Omnitrophota bacterium]
MNEFLLKSGNFLFKYRNALFPSIFVLMFFFTRPALFLNNQTLDSLVVAIGIIAALSGQIFRMAVIGYAYIKRGGKDGKVYADDLVIRGFYAHTRNPMYVGNFLIAVGLGLVYGSPAVYFFLIPFFIYAYLAITAAEEKYLGEKFGDQFTEYTKRVNRFVPNFKGLKQSLSGFQYDWKKSLRKEYGTLFGTLFGLVFIGIWKIYYVYGFSAGKKEIFTLTLLLIPIAAGYAYTRYLKKSGQLASPQGDNEN